MTAFEEQKASFEFGFWPTSAIFAKEKRHG